jgi:hypothetical protein
MANLKMRARMPRDATAPRPTAKQRYLKLSGESLEKYAQTAARLVWAARLNKWYPDPFACADRLRFLAPSLSEGLYPAVYLDKKSGMPRLKDILAVQVDQEIASKFLAQHQARITAGRRLTPRVQAKIAYYERLSHIELPRIHHLEVKLRRVDAARSVAAFQVVFDRFDMGEGVLVRYTVLLEQTDRKWGSSLLERSGDYTRQTSQFRDMLERLAQDESEILFLLLGKKEGLRIEEIVRGRIGPLWSPWSPAPAGWSPRSDQESFILHCPLDRTSIYHEEDVDNDPFSDIYRDFLSLQSRPLIEEAALQLGYRVNKERKFACTPAAEVHLRNRLKKAKTRNVVYAA